MAQETAGTSESAERYFQQHYGIDHHFGVPQSGNGRRETFRHFPMPRMTNT